MQLDGEEEEEEVEVERGRMTEAAQEMRLTNDRGPDSPSNPPIPQYRHLNNRISFKMKIALVNE